MVASAFNKGRPTELIGSSRIGTCLQENGRDSQTIAHHGSVKWSAAWSAGFHICAVVQEGSDGSQIVHFDGQLQWRLVAATFNFHVSAVLISKSMTAV